MFDWQLQFERPEQVCEQYRQEAVLHNQRKLARSGSAPAVGPGHPLRRRLAAALRRAADAVEPAPHHPPLNV